MHPDLLEIYRRKVLLNIEHPIREIVDSLWELPFVVDTNEACSGHIVTSNYMKSLAQYEPIQEGLFWYPHSIRLGIDFSLDEGLREEAEKFRSDVSSIEVDIGLRGHPLERSYKTVDGHLTKVLHVFYHSDFPDRNFTPPAINIDNYIKNTQNRLVAFWEAFAQIIRMHNPKATISPIADRNFLEIIDWADLGDVKRYFQ